MSKRSLTNSSMRIFELTTSTCQNLSWPPCSSSSKWKTVPFNPFRTTENLIRWQLKTINCSHSFKSYSTGLKQQKSSPSSTSTRVTTMYRSKRVTNGKSPSTSIGDYSNLQSCSSILQIHWPCSKPWWTIYSKSLSMKELWLFILMTSWSSPKQWNTTARLSNTFFKYSKTINSISNWRNLSLKLIKPKYLRMIVSNRKVSMDPKKVRTMADWNVLWKKRELQAFFSFCNFYQHFIKDFSTIAWPLAQLAGNTAWDWTQVQQGTFNKLKRHILITQF